MEYPIIVNKGDNVIVKVKNEIKEPTAIHWHGMFQNGTNWFDGAAGVTQCPIKTHKALWYHFSIPNQHGTYWWHAHHKAQYVKGIRGPLIVRDPENEPYTDKYDEEKIVMLTDWFHAKSSDELLVPFLKSSDGVEPLPDSGLINGKGRYDCTLVKDGTPCDPNAPLEVFNFTPGKRYRLRIINGGAQATMNFSIDGHRMHVIEADGVDTKWTTVDILSISPGQRYSVIVNADAKAKNYWMRATIDTMSYAEYKPGVFNPKILAIVSYTGSNEDPKTQGPPSNAVMLDQYNLVAYKQSPISNRPDKTLRFSFEFDDDSKKENRAFVTIDGYFNQSVYSLLPGRSTLQRVISGNNLKGTSANAVNLDYLKTIDMIVYNKDTMVHPFHLHGHTFQVVGSGILIGDDKPVVRKGPYPERDTIAAPSCIPKGPDDCGDSAGYVVIRFYTNNPGIWLFHCHIEWHVLQGLGMTFVVDQKTIQKRGIPYSVSRHC